MKMRKQEHNLYLLWGIPRNTEWIVFLELIVHRKAVITAMPDESMTNLMDKAAPIMGENGLAPETLLFARKGATGGKGGKEEKGPKRDKRNNKNDRKEKD